MVDLLKDLPCAVEPVVPCVDPWRYRNKFEFVFGTGSDQRLILGLRRRGSYQNVLDVNDCWLQSTVGNRLRILTKDFFAQRSYVAYHPNTHQGLLRFLIVRESFSQQKLMANLVVASVAALPAEDLQAWVNLIRGEISELASVYLSEQPERSDTAFSENLQHLWGDEALYETLRTKEAARGTQHPALSTFKISPLAFFQTNSRQVQILYDTLNNLAGLTGQETVLDLYCGTGTISQLLARDARWIYGIESVAPAIADAKINAQNNHVANVTYITDKVETWLKWNGDEVDADVWVLDPPRSGLNPKILNKRLRELVRKPQRIVYVSCNPKHLPSDLSKLLDWYDIEHVVPVDMFPHTPHLEVVISLHKR